MSLEKNIRNKMANYKHSSSSARYHGTHKFARANSTIVGYYSLDVDRNYLPDSSKMLYFIPPKDNFVTWDLDAGRETAILRDVSCRMERLKPLLQWIIENQETIRSPPGTDRLLQPNFVCTVGLLVKFMIAPYSPFDHWRILAAKWKGTIYLAIDKSVNRSEDANSKKCGSWGKKFEQYVLSDSPHKAPDIESAVKETEEFRCVYQLSSFPYSVLFSSVAKGVLSKEVLKDPLDTRDLKFVDIRTNKIIQHAGHERLLRRHKALSWWATAYFNNTEEVWCGFRTDNGVVSKLHRYNSEQLIGLGKNYWDPDECVKSVKTFLSKLTEVVIQECDEIVYELVRKSFDDFDITELVPSEENSVLSQAFMDAIR